MHRVQALTNGALSPPCLPLASPVVMAEPEYGRRYRSPYSQRAKATPAQTIHKRKHARRSARSKPRPRPEWDDTVHDLTAYKASPQEQVGLRSEACALVGQRHCTCAPLPHAQLERKLSMMSRHNALAFSELSRKYGSSLSAWRVRPSCGRRQQGFNGKTLANPGTTLAPDGTPIIQLTSSKPSQAIHSEPQNPPSSEWPRCRRGMPCACVVQTLETRTRLTGAAPDTPGTVGPQGVARALQFSSPAPAVWQDGASPLARQSDAVQQAPREPCAPLTPVDQMGTTPAGTGAPMKAPDVARSRFSGNAVSVAKSLAPAFGVQVGRATPAAQAPRTPAPRGPGQQGETGASPFAAALSTPASKDKFLSRLMKAVSRSAARKAASAASRSCRSPAQADPQGMATALAAAATAAVLSPDPAPAPAVLSTPANYSGMQRDEGTPEVGPADSDASRDSCSTTAPDADTSFGVTTRPVYNSSSSGVIAAVSLPKQLAFVAGQSPPPSSARRHTKRKVRSEASKKRAAPATHGDAMDASSDVDVTGSSVAELEGPWAPDASASDGMPSRLDWGSATDLDVKSHIAREDPELAQAIAHLESNFAAAGAPSHVPAADGEEAGTEAEEEDDLCDTQAGASVALEVTSDSALLQAEASVAAEATSSPAPTTHELHMSRELASTRAQLAVESAARAGLAEEVAELRACLAQITAHPRPTQLALPQADEPRDEEEAVPSVAPLPSPPPQRPAPRVRQEVGSCAPPRVPVPTADIWATDDSSSEAAAASVFNARLAAVQAESAAAGSSPLQRFNELRERIMAARRA